jgi:hypothetical protein
LVHERTVEEHVLPCPSALRLRYFFFNSSAMPWSSAASFAALGKSSAKFAIRAVARRRFVIFTRTLLFSAFVGDGFGGAVFVRFTFALPDHTVSLGGGNVGVGFSASFVVAFFFVGADIPARMIAMMRSFSLFG